MIEEKTAKEKFLQQPGESVEPHGEEQAYFDALRLQWFVERHGEWIVSLNDGDICVRLMTGKDSSLQFRPIVRLDPSDSENPDAPLSREELLAKYPLHPSVVAFPDANPITSAKCQRIANNYHKHEKEFLSLSFVEKYLVLAGRDVDEAAHVKSKNCPTGIGLDPTFTCPKNAPSQNWRQWPKTHPCSLATL